MSGIETAAAPDRGTTPSGATSTDFARVLGLGDAICVVIGAIIGVGIFFTPRDVARVTGGEGAALLAWSIGGAIALLGAFTFAELGRLRPRAGGQYLVIRDAYGRLPSFLFVFCNLTAVQAGGVAIIAILCALNLGVALWGRAPSPGWVIAMATACTWSLVLLNTVGVRTGARVQDATVFAKLVTLGTLVALAALVKPGPVAVGTPHVPAAVGIAPLFAGVAITLFAYGGWQQVLWIAGEVKDAERNVPRAIVLGVAIVVAAYLGANWAYLHLLGFAGVKSASALAAEAFSVATSGVGKRLAAAAVAVSAFGVLNAQFLTGPRLTWAMAHDGLFFRPFARLHPRFATPVAALVLLGALATLLIALGLERTDLLTTGVVVVDATFFALSGLALPVLRRRAPVGERGAAWLVGAAIAFSLLELAAIVGSIVTKDVRVVALTALGWIAAAAAFWWFCFRSAPGGAPSAARSAGHEPARGPRRH